MNDAGNAVLSFLAAAQSTLARLRQALPESVTLYSPGNSLDLVLFRVVFESVYASDHEPTTTPSVLPSSSAWCM